MQPGYGIEIAGLRKCTTKVPGGFTVAVVVLRCWPVQVGFLFDVLPMVEPRNVVFDGDGFPDSGASRGTGLLVENIVITAGYYFLLPLC